METTYRLVVLGDQDGQNVGQDAATSDLAKQSPGSLDRVNRRLAMERTDFYYDFNKKCIVSRVIMEAEDTPDEWQIGPQNNQF